MKVVKIFLGLVTPWIVVAQDLLTFNGSGGGSSYLLAQQGTGPTIYCASTETNAVKRTAQDFATDFGKIVGTNGTIVTSLNSPLGPVIITGTIGKSSIVDALISNAKIDVSGIRDKWETYLATVVSNPVAGIPQAFVIIGSDRRGTIYGMYEVSERMGVSPLYWWADVPPKTKQSVWATGVTKTSKPPSVQWRGIFINNESPSLTTWANGRFPRSQYGSDRTDQFYARVFELLLRLKANYMWPAMWGKMFYLDTSNNGKISDDYGIVVGTSHHEPMARSEREQTLFMNGAWDWDKNRNNVSNFFREGARRAKDKETLFTLGMRGSGDAENPALTPATLEDIVKNQQQILQQELSISDLRTIPQTWVLYTEVGKYYQGGMKVPDSVTLLWSDDNYGNLLRIPLSNETSHGAGHGVYYHFDFNGGLRCYKWINTIQNIKTWEQMHLAYEKGARQIWITNIGDIKPLEIPMVHFLDMAYDFTRHSTPESVEAWTKRWASETFQPSIADVVADILTAYGKSIVRRKYEMLSDLPFVWSTSNYDEAEIVLQEWIDLLAKTQKVHDSLSPASQLPFFEMVLHPILAGKTVIEMYIKAAQNLLYRGQNRASTNSLANNVISLFNQDEQITQQYHGLLNGKWKGIVIQPHIGYSTWSDPPNNIRPPISWYGSGNAPTGSIFAIAAQGNQVFVPGSLNNLYSIDNFMPALDKRWFEVFARKNGTFSYSITTNASYVTLSRTSGTITAPGANSDARIGISVDWSAAPFGRNPVQLTVNGNNERITIIVPVVKRTLPMDFRGYVETGGVISMEVDRYESAETKSGLSYRVLPGYGRTRAGIKLWPVTAASQTITSGPKLLFSFYSFSATTSASLTIHLGTSINHDPARPLKYAFAFDNGNPVIVQPVPNHAMGTLPNGWNSATIAGGWASTTGNLNIPSGAHKLNLWLLEPGVVVQKIVLSVGGLRPSANGPQENVFIRSGSGTTSTTSLASATSTSPLSQTMVTTAKTSTTVLGTTRSTTALQSNSNCAALYGQCGGNGWTGPICCESATCKFANEWYSQCV